MQRNEISDWLKSAASAAAFVLPDDFFAAPALPLDLTGADTEMIAAAHESPGAHWRLIRERLQAIGGKMAYGGYLEHRALYDQLDRYAAESRRRSVHLGLDFWTDAGTEVRAVLDGEVHSFADNAGEGNYGPTVILRHTLANRTLHSLYGHLDRASLGSIQTGQKIKAGVCFAKIGPFPENGNWCPHLHFQLICDLEGWAGDYPGVVFPEEVPKYAGNCPDPMRLFPGGITS